MFSIDERLRGLPALKEQVVQLYQSLNAPHLAVPGRRAGPATGYVLGLRGPSGFAVFVYLYLAESGECAVYVPSSGTVSAEQYQAEEAEALSFTESMGFIMDNLNFRARPPDEQEQMIRSLPIFQREPPAPSEPGQAAGSKPGTGRSAGVVTLGKLFAAFCLAMLVGCAHTEADREAARSHYELAVNNLTKSPQNALKEVEEALKVLPEYAEAWHVKALLLHHSFGRLEEAQQCYVKAMELKGAPFSEARTNLGNLYMDQKRWDDAIAQYETALNDMSYGAPFIAHANMGWALYKKGDEKGAVEHLKTAITINPGFCLAYLQLGNLYEASGARDESCKYLGRYREHCPEQPDAWQREGVCQLNAGQHDAAKKSFATCIEKSKTDDQKDVCRQLAAQTK